MSNVLVTGGTGQIGAFVCEELIKNDHDVTIFDFKPNLSDIERISSKVKVLSGDVLDFEELCHVIRANKISHIIHLAAMLVLESKERPAKSIRVNCVGTNNVFEASRIFDIKRTVFTSSVVVYGLPKYYPSMKVNEDDFPRCPPEPYSIGKFTNESMSEFYRQQYGLDVLCLRLTGAWGPGRYWGYTGRFNDFIRNVALEKSSELPEDFAFKNAKMRWLYVKEMASAIAFSTFVQREKIKLGVYNTGSSKPFNSLDLVECLRELAPQAKIKFKETDHPTTTSSTIAGPSGLDVDCSRFYNELGFKETMGMKDALKDMVNYERTKANLKPI